MALTEKLELLLTADPSQGISALKQFSSEAEKSATKSTSALEKVAGAALKIGAGGIAVGGFLTQMASADVEASNQLKTAIANVGESQDVYRGRIEATVDAQTEFGHTQDEVKSALTKLVFSYNDTSEALDQMQLVADLAARKHISLSDAAGLVAKAHGGSAKLFKEFGIQVRENADGTKDYDAALTDLADKLSGQATAAADSFDGQLQEIRANLTNLVSDFGANFGPAILGVSTVLATLGGAFEGITLVTGKFRAASAAKKAALAAETAGITANTAATLANTGATAANTGAAIANSTATNSAASVQGLYAKNAGASKAALGGVGTVIAAVTFGLYEYGKSLNDTTLSMGELQSLGDQTWDVQTQAVVEMVDEFKGPFAGVIDQIIDKYRAMGPAGVEQMTRIRDAIAAAGGDTSKFDAAIEGATQSEENMAGATKKANDKLKDQADRYKDIQSAADDAFAATLKLAPADIRAQQGALQITDAKDRLTQAEQDLIDAQKGETASSIDSRQALLDQKEAVARLGEARAKLRMGPGPGDDAAAMRRAVEQAYLDVQKANQAVSELNIAPDPDKIADAQRAVEDAQLAYTGAVEGQAQALLELKNTQDEANGITSTAETKTRDYLNILGYLNANLTGPTHDALAVYIWDLTVAANKTERLRIEALGGTGGTGMHVDLSRTAANRATGGTGFPGSTYFIEPGTKGEYFTPTMSGWFTPVDKMGKGGYTVNIGQIVTADPQDAGAAVARRLRIEAALAAP